MIYLEDIRDFIDSLHIAEHVYMGKMPDKKVKSIGVYHLKRSAPYQQTLGGKDTQSYGVKQVSFLVHWTNSPRETEKAAFALFDKLEQTKNAGKIKFIFPLVNEPVDIGADNSGIYEMVIEAGIYYERKGE